jgi:hypothetical protein
MPCQEAVFNVAARGVGGLTYQWRRDGTPLVNSERISGATSPSLHITGVRFDNEGAYDCLVTDSCETRGSNSATLTINLTPTWVQRVTDQPVKRTTTAMAYDAQRHVIVLYGGYAAAGYVKDTWEWDGLTWTQKSPPTTPGRRSNHAMAYDSDRHRVVLFGGINGEIGPALLADLWEYDGTNWVQRPSDILAHAGGFPTTTPELTYDSLRKRLVLVRNQAGTTNNSETYEYDSAAGLWQLKVADNGFPAGYGGAMAFDARQNVSIHYLSYNPSYGIKATGRYNGTNWVMDQVTTPMLPFTNMAYDSTRRRAVIFGANPNSNAYDTRSFYANGSDWTTLLPAGPPSSPPIWTALPSAMAYDSHRRAMVSVLWNYYSAGDGPMETWEYRYIDRVVIDRQPQHQPLNPGTSAVFSVQAVGYGTLSYRWKRNGANLVDGPAAGGGLISGATTAVRTINPVGAADEGGYAVEVSNGCSKLLSNTAFLGTIPNVAGDLDHDGDVDRADLDALNITSRFRR